MPNSTITARHMKVLRVSMALAFSVHALATDTSYDVSLESLVSIELPGLTRITTLSLMLQSNW